MQQSKLFSQHYAIAVAFCMLKRLRSQDLRQGGEHTMFTWIYIALSRETSNALRHGSHSFTCRQHLTCLYLVSIHQIALPLIMVHR